MFEHSNILSLCVLLVRTKYDAVSPNVAIITAPQKSGCTKLRLIYTQRFNMIYLDAIFNKVCVPSEFIFFQEDSFLS